MSERTLKRLLGVLGGAAVLWLVVFLVSSREPASEAEITGPIAAFFESATDSTLTAVRLSHPGATVELRRVDGSWVVNGFKSDSGAVARFFQTLGDTEVDGLAASNPSNHARMGVDADTAATLEFEAGGSTRRLLVGLDGPRGGTIYARIPDEDAVYLLTSGLRNYLYRGLDDWRNRKMLAIDTSQVRRITVERDADSFALVRTDSVWTFEGGGAADGRHVQSLLNELGGGLVASRFIAPGDSIGALPQGGATVAYSASGEQLAAVTVGSGSGDRWATAAGDSVRYRIPPFRVDAIVPTLESLRP
ncbi:MAG: DUF4340 domain-containing protein [Gemmatimonadetes bacterium]|nr:DUF4340 domain-containing protein [Gemmatimonadota bacterium]